MTTVKEEYPFLEKSGIKNYKMIKFYAEDEEGTRYKVRNQQTGKVLEEAVCLYPSPFTYEPTREKCLVQNNVFHQKKAWKPKNVSRETKDTEPEIVEEEVVKEEKGDEEE